MKTETIKELGVPTPNYSDQEISDRLERSIEIMTRKAIKHIETHTMQKNCENPTCNNLVNILTYREKRGANRYCSTECAYKCRIPEIYTSDAIAYIKENWGKIPTVDIATYLGATVRGLRTRVTRLRNEGHTMPILRHSGDSKVSKRPEKIKKVSIPQKAPKPVKSKEKQLSQSHGRMPKKEPIRLPTITVPLNAVGYKMEKIDNRTWKHVKIHNQKTA